MQDCSSGCKDLMWDLLDCTGWEYMFNTTDRQLMLASFQEADNDEAGPQDEGDGGKLSLLVISCDACTYPLLSECV